MKREEILKLTEKIFEYVLNLEDEVIEGFLEDRMILKIEEVEREEDLIQVEETEIEESEIEKDIAEVKKELEEIEKDIAEVQEKLEETEIEKDIAEVKKELEEKVEEVSEAEKEIEEVKKCEPKKEVVEGIEEAIEEINREIEKDKETICIKKKEISKFLVEDIKSREEALEILNDKSLKKDDLKKIAKENNIYIKSRDTKSKIIDKIIEGTIGSKLRNEILSK